MARRGPRPAIRAAELGARIVYFARRGKDSRRFLKPKDVTRLFSGISEKQAEEISKGIFLRQKLNLAVRTIVGDGGRLAPLDELIETRNFEFLRERARHRQPTVIVEWHCGPLVAINAALRSLDVPIVKVLVQHYFEMPKNWIALKLDAAAANEAAMLKQALKHVRSGCIAAMACDSVKESPKAVWLPVLGSKAPFQKGAMTLAVLANAPAVPVCAWWNMERRRVVIEALEPMLPESFPSNEKTTEDRMLEHFALLFERYLQTHPMDASKRVYQSLLRAKDRVASVPVFALTLLGGISWAMLTA